MNKNESKNYTHFFVEIIIAILFLSIVSVVIMYIYSATNKKMTLSAYKSSAAKASMKFIDNYKSTHDVDNSVKEAFGNGNYEIQSNDDNTQTYLEIDLNGDFAISDANTVKVIIYISDDKDDSNVEDIELTYIQNVFESEDNLYEISAGVVKE